MFYPQRKKNQKNLRGVGGQPLPPFPPPCTSEGWFKCLQMSSLVYYYFLLNFLWRGSKKDFKLNNVGNHEEAEIQMLRNALGTERDGHDGYYCDTNILLWRFKMVHWTLFMLDALVTFQDGADLEQHTDDTDNLVSRFLSLGTCTGRPRTHRTANDSIRKRFLRRRN